MTHSQSPATNSQFPSIPGFEVLALAGRGGMGAVYKAEQAAPRRTVALKVLRGASASAESLAAFRREAQTIAALEHPYIVPLYGFGEHEGTPYLALRYLNGGAVAERLGQGPLELDTAVRWIANVTDALDFAHARGIVHRDIKPSNILLDESGNAYLSDFGIAGVTAAATSGPPTGSAAYMPPEQGRGEAVDGRGDLYSLAVTLFEMLTGQKPYTAETAFGVVVRHLNDPIPPARALNPSIPPAVDEFIQWGMAKSPDERPQTAAEFARSLKQALAHPDEPIRPAAIGGQTLVSGATVAAPGPQTAAMGMWVGIGIAVAAALCLGGIVVALAGGTLAFLVSGSPTPIPTATEFPTPTPAPTIPPAPTKTPDPDGGIFLLENGAVQIVVRRNLVEWFRPLEQPSEADVVIEATVTQESGPALNEMALVCRWQDADNYAAFAVSGDGTYSIWRKFNGEVTRLVDWSPSPAINPGAGSINQLRATCRGEGLKFEVNSQEIGQTADPNPIGGDVALMAGLREEGVLVVTFNEVRVTQP